MICSALSGLSAVDGTPTTAAPKMAAAAVTASRNV
jgi:hypothetical protein